MLAFSYLVFYEVVCPVDHDFKFLNNIYMCTE